MCSRRPNSAGFAPLTWFLALVMLTFSATSALAAAELPRQSLAVDFDLGRQSLTATSAIEIPAQTEVVVNFEGLEITRLIHNGEAIAAQTVLTIPAAAETQRLSIDYRLTIPAEAHAAAGLINAQGISLTGHWYPRLNTESFYALTAVVPNDFSAISEAEEITTTPEADGRQRISFHYPHPLGSLNFIAGPYVVEKEPFGNNQTLYSYFFKEDQELAADYRQKTLAYLARYEKLIGPYPFKRFAIVENRLPTGYAMATFTLLGQAVVRLPFITETSLGHEVLHGWFGNAVRMDLSQGNWCEGLTTYLADHAFAQDRNEAADFRKQQQLGFQSYVNNHNVISLQNFSGGVSHLNAVDQGQRTVGYAKGSMVFHMLRQSIGDAAFYNGLKDFYLLMRYSQANWQDLAASFEKTSGKPLAPFFSQWLTRKDLPIIAATNIWLLEENGKPKLSFTIQQLQDHPYQLTVPVKVVTASGEHRHFIAVTEKETQAEIILDSYPSKMVIDPDYDLMRGLRDDEVPPTWSVFAGDHKKLVVLPEPKDEAIYAPLLKILTEQDCPTKTASEVTDGDVADRSVLFLGTDSRIVRALFASPALPTTGFTIEAKSNPLAAGHVAILVAAADADQTAAAGRKLRHYGKYGYLHFEMGRITEKKTAPSNNGLYYELDQPPAGIALQKKLSFADIISDLADKRVVYVGETHTRVEDHLLQLRVIRSLYEKNKNLVIGMEMFNRSAQDILDRYTNQEIDEWEFLKKSHYFEKWGYDYRLYRDIINFARQNKITIVALNLEKDLVSKVFKQGGIQALSEDEQALIPIDRDLDLPGYRERITEVFNMHGKHGATPEQVNDFLQAQALWDETMAQSITDYLTANPAKNMVVVVGNGHTVKNTAIPPRVSRRAAALTQAVILNDQNHNISPAEADYLLFSPPAQLPPAPLLGVMLTENKEGVLVAELSKNSKAMKAGIKAKDILLAIDDEPISAVEDLKIILLYKKIGDTIEVRIKRNAGLWDNEDGVQTITVTL